MSGLTVRRRSPVVAAQEQPERDIRRCAVERCPFRGTIDRGNTGRYFCVCHDNRSDPREWPAITAACRENSWLGSFVEDLLAMANTTARQETSWVEFAEKFWAGIDDHCLPSKFERSLPSLYVRRMLAELRWRCGVAKDRPQPAQEPAYPVRRGNFANLLSVEASA